MFTGGSHSHSQQPLSPQTKPLTQLTPESQSHLLSSDNHTLQDEDLYGPQDDDEDLYEPRDSRQTTCPPPQMTYPPPQKKDFGQDTAIKAAEFAGSEIYVEDMWGELVQAEPGYVPPKRRHGVPRIPDQSIPDIPGQPIPNLELDPIGVGVQVGNMLKGVARRLFGKVSPHIEIQKRSHIELQKRDPPPLRTTRQ